MGDAALNFWCGRKCNAIKMMAGKKDEEIFPRPTLTRESIQVFKICWNLFSTIDCSYWHLESDALFNIFIFKNALLLYFMSVTLKLLYFFIRHTLNFHPRKRVSQLHTANFVGRWNDAHECRPEHLFQCIFSWDFFTCNAWKIKCERYVYY